MEQSKVINVVTGQGGAGHYATYHAIRALAERKNLPWKFQVTDMDEIITHLSEQNQVKNAYEMFGFSGHDLYNLMVKGGWMWLWPLKMRLNKLLVKMNHEIGVKIFTEYWQRQRPDLVVSVMPLYNRGLWQSLQQAQPGTPYITVMTDFADSPPDFWMDREIDSVLVCGTEKAVEQAQQLGIAKRRVAVTSGLVVHPDFCGVDRCKADKRERRSRLNLNPDLPTGVVMFGGNGSATMQAIAHRLERLEDRLQLIFLCGNNDALAASLRQYEGAQKRCVVEFTDSVHDYLSASDFFIGKPGNVSISEAIATSIPIITERNRLTMVQEKDCANWIEAQGYGIVLSSFKAVDKAVENMLEPDTYSRYQQAIKEHQNRAVYEVVALMQQVLEPGLKVQTPVAQVA